MCFFFGGFMKKIVLFLLIGLLSLALFAGCDSPALSGGDGNNLTGSSGSSNIPTTLIGTVKLPSFITFSKQDRWEISYSYQNHIYIDRTISLVPTDIQNVYTFTTSVKTGTYENLSFCYFITNGNNDWDTDYDTWEKYTVECLENNETQDSITFIEDESFNADFIFPEYYKLGGTITLPTIITHEDTNPTTITYKSETEEYGFIYDVELTPLGNNKYSYSVRVPEGTYESFELRYTVKYGSSDYKSWDIYSLEYNEGEDTLIELNADKTVDFEFPEYYRITGTITLPTIITHEDTNLVTINYSSETERDGSIYDVELTPLGNNKYSYSVILPEGTYESFELKYTIKYGSSDYKSWDIYSLEYNEGEDTLIELNADKTVDFEFPEYYRITGTITLPSNVIHADTNEVTIWYTSDTEELDFIFNIKLNPLGENKYSYSVILLEGTYNRFELHYSVKNEDSKEEYSAETPETFELNADKTVDFSDWQER